MLFNIKGRPFKNNKGCGFLRNAHFKKIVVPLAYMGSRLYIILCIVFKKIKN